MTYNDLHPHKKRYVSIDSNVTFSYERLGELSDRWSVRQSRHYGEPPLSEVEGLRREVNFLRSENQQLRRTAPRGIPAPSLRRSADIRFDWRTEVDNTLSTINEETSIAPEVISVNET